jgi:hypothetical protein
VSQTRSSKAREKREKTLFELVHRRLPCDGRWFHSRTSDARSSNDSPLSLLSIVVVYEGPRCVNAALESFILTNQFPSCSHEQFAKTL